MHFKHLSLSQCLWVVLCQSFFQKGAAPPPGGAGLHPARFIPGSGWGWFFAMKLDRVVVTQFIALVPPVTFVEGPTSAINCVTTHKGG